jgi:hypothetical protein
MGSATCDREITPLGQVHGCRHILPTDVLEPGMRCAVAMHTQSNNVVAASIQGFAKRM